VAVDYPGYWGLDIASDIEFGKMADRKLDQEFDKNVRSIAEQATRRFPYGVSLIEKFQQWLGNQIKTGPMEDLNAKVIRTRLVLKRMINETELKNVSDYYLANETLRGVEFYRHEILQARKSGIIPFAVLEKLEGQVDAEGPNSAAAKLLHDDRVQASAEYHMQKAKYSCFTPWEMYETDTRAAF